MLQKRAEGHCKDMNYTIKAGNIEVEVLSCSIHYRAEVVIEGTLFANELTFTEANYDKATDSYKSGVEVTDLWLAKQILKAKDCKTLANGTTELIMDGFEIIVRKD